VVTVLDVRGDQVRIGIKAPRSVDVHREEVFFALQRSGAADEVSVQSEDGVIDLATIDAATAPEAAAVVPTE